MELSKERIKSLIALQDAGAISDESFNYILEAATSRLCGQTETKSMKNDTRPVNGKTAFADISCLFIEAARHDLDEETFANFLSDAKITGNRAKKLCDAYKTNKNGMQSQLELIGYSPRHIVDIDWRLDYCIKVDTCNSVGIPLYHVRLTTKQEYDTETRTGAGSKDVTFTCTIQQLQELVSKLKDAVRHLEKLINL